MSTWDILITPKASASENMLQDAFLLENMSSRNKPLIHFYDWQSHSITYGHFIKPHTFFDFSGLKKYAAEIAKRPTGGGIIFHGRDMTFSFLIPKNHPAFFFNTLQSYAFINRIVLDAVGSFLGARENLLLLSENKRGTTPRDQHFCMANPTQYDLMFRGFKIGGAAQRKTKDGFLHQGSLFLGLPSQKYVEEVIQNGNEVFQAIHTSSIALLGNRWDEQDFLNAKKKIQELLIQNVIAQHSDDN